MKPKKTPKDPLKRVMQRVFKTDTCWYWMGCLSEWGYGKTNLGSKYHYAHKLIYELVQGFKVPEGLVVKHSCDTPFCVNPEHLSLGTKSENTQEAHDRGCYERGRYTRETAMKFLEPYREAWKKKEKETAISGLPWEVADRIEKTETCWVWAGPDDSKQGYGRVYLGVNGKYTQAHRYVYERLVGPIGKGLILRHTCDNPRCVNPEHLIPGTAQENARDRQERDRGRVKPGERHPGAKLTDREVVFMKYLLASKKPEYGDQTKIARAFGVTTVTVNAIAKGRIWRHIQVLPREAVTA